MTVPILIGFALATFYVADYYVFIRRIREIEKAQNMPPAKWWRY